MRVRFVFSRLSVFDRNCRSFYSSKNTRFSSELSFDFYGIALAWGYTLLGFEEVLLVSFIAADWAA